MAVSLSLAIKQNSQNIANNTSNVTVTVGISWTYGSWNHENPAPSGNLVIDGTSYAFSSTFNPNKTSTGSQTLFTKTVNVTHSDNGSKTLYCSASFDSRVSSGNVTASASKTLTTIARASQPSCITYPEHTQNVGEFGNTITIHMNRKSSAFTHTVRYVFGSKSGTCINADTGKATNRDVETGVRWEIPEELMDLIPSSTSGSGTIYVDTYNGSTKVGTKSCGFTATVPASVKPTCTMTLEDVTGVDKIYGSPVKGLSKIKVTVTAKIAYSSKIATYSISANGAKYTTATATTGALSKSGTSTVTATVKDNRKRSGSVSYDMTVLNYSAPTVTALAVLRCNQDGTANDRGEYVKVRFSATVSSMSSKNNATYKLKYKKSSASSYTEVSLSALVNKYSVSNYEYIFAADGSSSYDVTVTATDRHSTATRSTSASTAFTLVNYHQDGNALRFGGVATEQDAFQNDLTLIQSGNRYCYSSIGEASTDGYILMAQIEVTATNSDTPITFVFTRRKALSPMKVHVSFVATADTAPALNAFRYEGENYGAFLVRSADSVWDLYVQKVSNSDTVTLNDWYTSYRQMNRVAITFPGTIATTLPTGLEGWYRATPLVSRSILDAFYPVGYILLLYSHDDPNDMYPGTTWTRIYGAFPWFTDANGEIGLTGGERNVTLTVDQIPAHTHGSVYSGDVSGTKKYAWLSSGGSAMGYASISKGGGQAHNNMPPYIQISAWRRTA